MKAQASIEYLFIFGFSLIVIGLLWIMSSSNIEDTRWELQLAYAKNSLGKIVQTADIAYVQGAPTQIYINVDFPDNIRAVYVNGNEITMELRWKGFLRNVSAYSIANMTGYMSPAPGQHRLLVKADQIVKILES